MHDRLLEYLFGMQGRRNIPSVLTYPNCLKGIWEWGPELIFSSASK